MARPQLPLDWARCDDVLCPSRGECARAEELRGEGRFVWLPLDRSRGARRCSRFIERDPAFDGVGDGAGAAAGDAVVSSGEARERV